MALQKGGRKIMRAILTTALFLPVLFACSKGINIGHRECENAFKELSHGEVQSVPEVMDWGNDREFSFSWNDGSKSKPIPTPSGPASGHCTIDKQTGKGFVTLRGRDLGDFQASFQQ